MKLALQGKQLFTAPGGRNIMLRRSNFDFGADLRARRPYWKQRIATVKLQTRT
jgi:hypothetical protein